MDWDCALCYLWQIYPLDLMQKVVGYLQQQHTVFLFGHGPKEAAQIHVWAKAYPHVIPHALEMPFADQLDLMQISMP